MRTIITIFIICISSMVFAPLTTYAQASFDDIVLSTTPEYPKPGESVTLRVHSNSIDLRGYGISWYQNGTLTQQGTGQVTYTTTTPDTTSTIRAVIYISPTSIIERSIVLKPGSVVLLWEAVDSFVPPGYRGKRLMPAEGTIRITALPDQPYKPENLIYTWKRNGTTIVQSSGFGKHTMITKNNFFDQTTTLQVIVTSPDGAFSAEGSVSIPRTTPFVLLKSISNTGIHSYEQISTTLPIIGTEATLSALPYFFSSRDGIRDLTLNWTINGEVYNSNNTSNQLSLAKPERNTPIQIQIQTNHQSNSLQNGSFKKTVLFQ